MVRYPLNMKRYVHPTIYKGQGFGWLGRLIGRTTSKVAGKLASTGLKTAIQTGSKVATRVGRRAAKSVLKTGSRVARKAIVPQLKQLQKTVLKPTLKKGIRAGKRVIRKQTRRMPRKLIKRVIKSHQQSTTPHSYQPPVADGVTAQTTPVYPSSVQQQRDKEHLPSSILLNTNPGPNNSSTRFGDKSRGKKRKRISTGKSGGIKKKRRIRRVSSINSLLSRL